MTSVITASTATRSNGPLTTLFTPSSSCLDVIVSGPVDSVNTHPTIAIRCMSSWPPTECWPPRPTSINSVEYPGEWVVGAYYSPGICPSNWQPQHVEYHPPTTSTDSQVVTAARCCPSGYEISPSPNYLYYGNCVSTPPIGGPLIIQVYGLTTGSDRLHTYGLLTKDGTTTLSSIGYGDVATVFAVEVRWRSQDVNSQFSQLATYLPGLASRFPSSTVASTTRSSFSSTSGLGSTPTQPPSTSDIYIHPGLSTGAIVGIAIAIIVFKILLVGACCLCCYRSRQRRVEVEKKTGPIMGPILVNEDHLKGPARTFDRPPSYRTVESNPTGPKALGR